MLLIEAKIKESDIHGIGLFSVEPIPRGAKVWEFHPLIDLVLDESQLATLPKPMHSFIQMYGYRSVATNELIINLDLSRHMNHSDTPNLVCDDESNYFAVCDIAPGTELTCDYRLFSQEGADFLQVAEAAV